MRRVVCDTNIYISALIFPGGKPEKVIKLATRKEIKLFISSFILSELGSVLVDKFDLSKPKIGKILSYISEFAILVEPQCRVSVVKKEENDNRIIECALECRADFLITGDKRHLLPLREYKGIKIVNADQFLNI